MAVRDVNRWLRHPASCLHERHASHAVTTFKTGNSSNIPLSGERHIGAFRWGAHPGSIRVFILPANLPDQIAHEVCYGFKGRLRTPRVRRTVK